MLDTRDAIGAAIKTQFPSVAEYCARNGIDPPARDPIPVAPPAAHYHMGGIATDTEGRATLPGLWVCGEASSTGLHGANRLASNGLLEALVYARICADGIAAATPEHAQAAPPVDIAFQPGGTPPCPPRLAVDELRQTMTRDVGVVRDRTGLIRALTTIARLEDAHGDSPSFRNMCATATLIAAGALMREESRGGAHERADFPPEPPLPGAGERSHQTLTQALEVRAAVTQELT